MSDRLDPKQEFVVASMTREEIADEVNETVENEGWDLPKMMPDDVRLTDEFCQAYVSAVNEAVAESDDMVDSEYQHTRLVVALEFDFPSDE